ncbi:hypothetical protein [Roseibium aggregatum]|uniref:Uncharacterized protein n=1 Tax=Roseibium aggregatum TaxID=187304 RepID=A0A0M6YC70_9HYPH|nr:hypothetical protein [Roseibium aggregatum]CTQ47304.1 hypothetical protein LAL4801_05766 [Roseibium aggregatum]
MRVEGRITYLAQEMKKHDLLKTAFKFFPDRVDQSDGLRIGKRGAVEAMALPDIGYKNEDGSSIRFAKGLVPEAPEFYAALVTFIQQALPSTQVVLAPCIDIKGRTELPKEIWVEHYYPIKGPDGERREVVRHLASTSENEIHLATQAHSGDLLRTAMEAVWRLVERSTPLVSPKELAEIKRQVNLARDRGAEVDPLFLQAIALAEFDDERFDHIDLANPIMSALIGTRGPGHSFVHAKGSFVAFAWNRLHMHIPEPDREDMNPFEVLFDDILNGKYDEAVWAASVVGRRAEGGVRSTR